MQSKSSICGYDGKWAGRRKVKLVFARSLLLVILFVLTACPIAVAEASADVANTKSKVLVVFIYDPHCRITCDKVRPAVREIQSRYAQSVSYVEIDTSDEHVKQSKALAEKNGVLWFYNDNLKFVPVVGFFSPERKCIKYLTGAKTKDVYQAALEKAMKVK